MKKLTKHSFSNKTLFICGFILLFSMCIYAANPIITSTYTAAPSPHQWSDGKYYMYCSHDQDADVDWNMVDYHVFSSVDLVHWVDNGIAFKNTDSPFGNGAALWAPDCMYRNGLYYLYYPQNSVIGVATSASPTGPFTNAKKLYQTGNSQYSYDPMIFVDDDNQAYLLVSSCMNPNGAFKPVLCKLGSDMMSITQETILSTTGNFHEGPWLFKRSGTYYLTWGGGDCSYSTSTSLTGPYTYQGVICNQWRDASGSLISGNQQHPGIACFSGQWYFASAWGAPDNKRRRIFMEYLYFNADGTIKFIAPDMQGVVAPGFPYYQVEAENYSTMSGVQVETCSDTNQGYDVCFIENGYYAVYQNMNFGSGASEFQARVASVNSGGTIEIHLDSLSGTLAGTCAVSGTGGWQTWVTKTCSVSGAGGIHNVYLKFAGASGNLFNLNWFKFIASTLASTPTPVPGRALGRTGRTFRLGPNPVYDILGRSIPAQGRHLSRAVEQPGIIVEKR